MDKAWIFAKLLFFFACLYEPRPSRGPLTGKKKKRQLAFVVSTRKKLFVRDGINRKERRGQPFLKGLSGPFSQVPYG